MQLVRCLGVVALGTVAVVLVACGESATEQPAVGDRYDDPRHGLSAEVPTGWQTIREPLSDLVYPEVILLASSYPIERDGMRRGQCSPRPALKQMPPDGVFVQVLEYTEPPPSDYFPKASFPPKSDSLAYSNDAYGSFECGGLSYVFAFTQRGHALQAKVWFTRGRVDPEARRRALQLLDTIEFD